LRAQRAALRAQRAALECQASLGGVNDDLTSET